MEYTHKIYWNNKYTGAKHAFDTTRKSAEIVNTIGDNNVTDPSDHISQAINAIKETLTPEYFDALQIGMPLYLSESNGFEWDFGIWQMAINSTAGVLAAVDTAIQTNSVAGSLSSGLHHASHKAGGGFCTVNGLAVAANHHKEKNITILDFDAHCGGGTVQTLRHLGIDNRVEQYDISTNYFDQYTEDDTHQIHIASNDAQYLRTVDNVLENLNQTDLVIYNAGTDPYPTVTHDTLAERDATVFQYCKDNNIPCAYVLAGGYTYSQTMADLVQSHINTLDAAERTR